MGLDTVELVMAFEEEFGVEIPNADAERMRSVGDVANYVFEELQRRSRTNTDADSVIERVRAVTVAQLGGDPDVVFP